MGSRTASKIPWPRTHGTMGTTPAGHPGVPELPLLKKKWQVHRPTRSQEVSQQVKSGCGLRGPLHASNLANEFKPECLKGYSLTVRSPWEVKVSWRLFVLPKSGEQESNWTSCTRWREWSQTCLPHLPLESSMSTAIEKLKCRPLIVFFPHVLTHIFLQIIFSNSSGKVDKTFSS